MIKICALNEESSEESEEEDVPTITREALEEQAVAKYKEALEFQRNNKLQDAEDILQELLNTKILQEVQKSDAIQGVVPPTLSLKYSCLKNVGNLELRKGCEDKALDYFLEALELDDTDVSLWFRTGCVAEKVGDLKLAATAFYQGLQCSPNHWPCLDHLVTILFAMNDYITCMLYVARGLRRDPDFSKGLALRDAMLKESPSLKQHYKEIFPADALSMNGVADEDVAKEIVNEALELRQRLSEANKEEPRPPLALSKPLSPSWISLGEEIIRTYHYIETSDAPISMGQSINLHRVRTESEGGTEMEEDMEVDEEQTENTEAKSKQDEEPNEDTESNKKGGRRRMFLESWVLGGQRRSARVRSTARREVEDITLGESLRRLIPLSLLSEGSKDGLRSLDDNSMDTMDMFKAFERQEGDLGVVTVRRTSANSQVDVEENIKKEEYFGTQREKDDIKKFIVEHKENWGINNLVTSFIQTLTSKEELTWPPKLIPIFIEIYNLYRKCTQHPNPLWDEYDVNDLKIDGEITLIHGELYMDKKSSIKKKIKDTNENIICNQISEDIGQLIFLQLREDLFKNNFVIRVHWLRAHVALQNKDPHEACACLQSVLQCLEKFPEGVIIPNCRNNGVLTPELVEKLLTNIERSRSLAGVEQLWEEQSWEELANVLEQSFQSQSSSNNQQRGIEGLCRSLQVEMFVDALLRLENQFQRCFHWLEVCLHEALNKYISNSEDIELQYKWAKVIEKILSGFIYCLEENDIKIFNILTSSKLSRLVQNLSHIICHQLEAPDNVIEMPIETIDPWIVLQQILVFEEGRRKDNEEVTSNGSSEESRKETDIPGSLMILFTAHEHLGKRSWCCLNEGALLLHAMDEIIPKLRSESFSLFRSKLTPYLEQIIYCLYAYPNKKTKGKYLNDHSVPQISLTFDRAQQLLEFYRPDELPEFDSYRVGSISADADPLFKKILTLVPSECDSTEYLQKLNDYINGKRTDIPKVTHKILPSGVSDINYLLGDYYFKNSDLSKAIEHYLLDICHNPTRLDSWAGMALARGSQLETQLNSCESIESETEFLKQANATEKCYKRTLELDNYHGLIWIEYGSFVYMIHSFCSRLLKQDSDKLSLEQFELLEEKKEASLTKAEECFKTASNLWRELGEDSAQQDERWLHHYMLGKIIEKREDDPITAIEQYQKAAQFLYENNATYPTKINYTNPPEYSIEALEVHYRIHACVLKYLEINEGKKLDEKYEKFFKKLLMTEVNGPFMTGKSKIDLENEKSEIVIIEPSNNKKRKSSTESSNESKKVHFDNDINNIMGHILDEVDKQSVTNATKTLMGGSEVQLQSTDDGKKADVKEKVSSNEKSVKSPQRRGSQESTTTLTSSTNSSSSSSSSSSSDSSSSSSSSSSSDSSDSSDSEQEKAETKTQDVPAEPKPKAKAPVFDPKIDHHGLVQACLKALEKCVLRFPEHYKALYRLAHYHFRSRTHRDVNKCRDLLLGPETGTTALHGLFQDRKPSNFFNGVWRIPVNEIDRPGCFASHMSRCVLLTMDLVRELRDHRILVDLCLQLKRTPDPDKKYLRDSEREQSSRQALVLAVQALRSKLKEMQAADERLPALCVDIYRSIQKVIKNVPNQDKSFNKLLADAYSMYKFGKMETDIPLLDVATKFAQQEITRSKAIAQGLVVSTPALTITSSVSTPTTPSSNTSTPTTVNAQARKERKERNLGSANSSRRGRPPLSRTNTPRSTNPPNLTPPFTNQHSSTSRGRPRGRPSAPFYSNMFSDPSFLTAAVQAQMPSLDAFNYSLFKAQMEGYQAQFLQHMMNTTSSSNPFSTTSSSNPFSGLSPTQLAQFASPTLSQQAAAISQLTSSPSLTQQALAQLNAATLTPQPAHSQPSTSSLLSQYNSTAQQVAQVAKDRPNLSVTAVNPTPNLPVNKPKSVQQPPKKPKLDIPQQKTSSSKPGMKINIPTKAKLKAKVPTPPPIREAPVVHRASSIPSQVRTQNPVKQSSPVPQQIRRLSPLPTIQRASPIPSHVRRSSPVPSQGRKSSPIPSQGRKSSPVPSQGHTSSSIPSQGHKSSTIPSQGHKSSSIPSQGHKSSPIPSQVRKPSPVPGGKSSPLPLIGRKSSPIPSQSRKSSPIPSLSQKVSSLSHLGQFPQMAHAASNIQSQARKSSPIPSQARKSSPIPPQSRKSSPGPPVLSRQSPIPPIRTSPIANPAPHHSNLIARGPPNLTPRPSTYISPPQAHSNPSLDRISREITITHTLPKITKPDPKPQHINLPLNLPSSITITSKSQQQKPTLDISKNAVSIEQINTVKPSEPKSNPKPGEQPKPGFEIITLE